MCRIVFFWKLWGDFCDRGSRDIVVGAVSDGRVPTVRLTQLLEAAVVRVHEPPLQPS